MNPNDLLKRLESVLDLQLDKSWLIISLYLKSDDLRLGKELLDQDEDQGLPAGAVGRYRSIPVYPCHAMQDHAPQQAEQAGIGFRYIQALSVD